MNTILISANKLDKIQQCHRLFNFTSVKDLTTQSKPVYMEEGDLFHHFLDLYYKAKIKSFDYNIDSLIELGRNHATELDLTSEIIDENIGLFREYVLYYQHDLWQPEESEVPFAEEIFIDKENDFRIVLEGKIDLLAIDNKTNTSLVIDHKRVGRNLAPYDRDNQKLAYCLVTGRKDFIINQIGDQKSLSVDKRMSRYYFNISPHQLEEFVNNAIFWTFEMIKVMGLEKEGSFIPGSYKSCSYFGKKCSFYEVCNTTPDNVQYKLEQLFNKKEDHDLFRLEK